MNKENYLNNYQRMISIVQSDDLDLLEGIPFAAIDEEYARIIRILTPRKIEDGTEEFKEQYYYLSETCRLVLVLLNLKITWYKVGIQSYDARLIIRFFIVNKVLRRLEKLYLFFKNINKGVSDD